MPQNGVVKYADGNESRLFMAIRCINNHDSIATLVMLKSILDPIKSHSRTNWSVEKLGLSIGLCIHLNTRGQLFKASLALTLG